MRSTPAFRALMGLPEPEPVVPVHVWVRTGVRADDPLVPGVVVERDSGRLRVVVAAGGAIVESWLEPDEIVPAEGAGPRA